uniref:Nucleotide-diphospho-sugar transferase domain-containing protein n=1 Tax=viral metagenome TaxID=1070528 RepID=A0A6C0I5Y5_9ZZZZ
MKIITSVVNNPSYIIIQYYLLKKFFLDDFEYIVFNDAKDFPDYSNFQDETIKKEIENTCNILNIKCINIPNEHHRTELNSLVRTSDSMNYMLKYQLTNPDKYLIIDSDMFLIDYLNPEKYYQHDCAVVLKQTDNKTYNYMWNGFVYFDMHKMKNLSFLNWDCRDGNNVGLRMNDWFHCWFLENNKHHIIEPSVIRNVEKDSVPVDNVLFIRYLHSQTWDEKDLPENLKHNQPLKEFVKTDIRYKRNKNIHDKYICEIYDNKFLHLTSGGNHLKEDKINHQYYTQQLINISHKLLHNLN